MGGPISHSPMLPSPGGGEGWEVVLTMGLWETDRPQDSGIVALDAEGIIVAFEEKPETPQSRLANGSIGGPGGPPIQYAQTITGRYPVMTL